MISRLGLPALWRLTICLLKSSVKCLGCLGSLIYGSPGTVHIGVANPVSAGTLFTYLGPALARAGPLPSTNNMIEGGANSQPGTVLRNHRGLTSVKRAKAVLWWCHARSGDARTARGKPAAMPTDAEIDFLFSVCSASPSPVLAGLMDGNGCSIRTHILSYKLLNASHHVKPYVLWTA